MAAKDLLTELETIVHRLDEMAEDRFFTAHQQVMLEGAARNADIAMQEAWDNT